MNSRHPNNAVIMQLGGMIIDCTAVDHAGVTYEGDGRCSVSVSFRCSPKVTKLLAEDHEHAMVILSKLKRGMVAAMTGDIDVLGQPPDDFDEGDDDDDDDTEPRGTG